MFKRKTKKEQLEFLIKKSLKKMSSIDIKKSFYNNFNDLNTEEIQGIYLFLTNHKEFKNNEEKIQSNLKEKKYNRINIFTKSLLIKKVNFFKNHFNIVFTIEEMKDFESKLMFKFINGC